MNPPPISSLAGRGKASGALLLAITALTSFSCATSFGDRSSYVFFGEMDPESDVWQEKVEAWQNQSRIDRTASPGHLLLESDAPLPEGKEIPLSMKIAEFASDEQRVIAKRINTWSQRQAFWHYKPEDNKDFDGDHWPTYRELLEKNGDDCDGLDLMSYELLGSFGFDPNTVFRAIVRRDSDRANHMVTLWFEKPDDPWVLDATRAMVRDMTLFSEIKGWTPTVMFNQTQQFSVFEAQRAAGWSHE